MFFHNFFDKIFPFIIFCDILHVDDPDNSEVFLYKKRATKNNILETQYIFKNHLTNAVDESIIFQAYRNHKKSKP
jgi:hypothetical protein